MLHALYTRMSRRGRAWVLRVRPTGWMAMVVAGGLLFLGADPTRSLAYQLFALMFGLLGAAMLSGGFFRARGAARRMVPPTCVPGVPVTVEIEVKNTGRRAWRGVRLLEVPPAPAPTLAEFTGQSRARREPQESVRPLVHLLPLFLAGGAAHDLRGDGERAV